MLAVLVPVLGGIGVLELFGQRVAQSRPRRPDYLEYVFSIGGFICVFLIALFILIGFLAAIARALRSVQPENRRMEPGQVWLALIPIFNLVWCTVVVERIAESLRNEFTARGMHGPDERYARTRGLTLLVLLASGVLVYPAILTYPAAFCVGIAYWRDMRRFAERLKPGAYAPPPTEEGW